MANIGGAKRESTNFDNTRYVGLFEAKVIAVNPSAEEFSEVLGIELKEGNKVTEYLGQSEEKNTKLRVDVWLEEVKLKKKFKVTFFLENKERLSRDGAKKQYINKTGTTTWAADPNDIPEWFGDYRVAFVGEEEFYKFMRAWLSQIDYRHESAVLEFDWKTLMKGNVRDIRDQIDGEYCDNVVAMATVRTAEKDGETKSYQNVFHKAFLPAYGLKPFRLMNYNDSKLQSSLKNKRTKELKGHEKFVLDVVGEFGCKDFYIFKDMKEYNPDDNLVASDAVISTDGDDY